MGRATWLPRTFFFLFLLLPPTPNPLPPGKGPFASLARVSIFYHFYLLPLSPPTALGGSAFYTRINQKQKTHGAQSSLLPTNILG